MVFGDSCQPAFHYISLLRNRPNNSPKGWGAWFAPLSPLPCAVVAQVLKFRANPPKKGLPLGSPFFGYPTCEHLGYLC